MQVSFELFKSNICHMVKDQGDIPFIIEILKSGEIRSLFNNKEYAHALYLLGMVDYLSRENGLPLCSDYRDIRSCKLKEPLYPAGIHAFTIVTGNEHIKHESLENAIPEFKRFNIVENDIRNVF